MPEFDEKVLDVFLEKQLQLWQRQERKRRIFWMSVWRLW